MNQIIFPGSESNPTPPVFNSGSIVESLKPALDKGKLGHRYIPHAEAAGYHDALALMIECMGGPSYRAVLGECPVIPTQELEILLSWSLSTMAAINNDPDGFAAWVGAASLSNVTTDAETGAAVVGEA